jgi:hypothetical protein
MVWRPAPRYLRPRAVVRADEAQAKLGQELGHANLYRTRSQRVGDDARCDIPRLVPALSGGDCPQAQIRAVYIVAVYIVYVHCTRISRRRGAKPPERYAYIIEPPRPAHGSARAGFPARAAGPAGLATSTTGAKIGNLAILRRDGSPPHSITSSARPRIDSGRVRPSWLAVFRLTTSSNVTGCITGRSAGVWPSRILPA